MLLPRNSLLIASLAAAGLAAAATGQTPLKTERIATGFNNPLWVGTPPGDEDRLFVAEQSTAQIRIIKDGSVLPTPFINIRSKISPGSEKGLLGVAFHPDYKNNGFFYVNYTRVGDGATIIERYKVSGDPDIADPQSGLKILGPITQPFSNHNGGGIEFGPDGYLYVAPVTAAAAATPVAAPRTAQSCSARSCASMSTAPRASSSPPPTRASEPLATTTTSGTTARATRGGSASTARPVTCTSATSVRTPARRSAASRPASAG